MDTGGPNASMCVSPGAVHSVGTVQGSAVRFSDGRRGGGDVKGEERGEDGGEGKVGGRRRGRQKVEGL